VSIGKARICKTDRITANVSNRVKARNYVNFFFPFAFDGIDKISTPARKFLHAFLTSDKSGFNESIKIYYSLIDESKRKSSM